MRGQILHLEELLAAGAHACERLQHNDPALGLPVLAPACMHLPMRLHAAQLLNLMRCDTVRLFCDLLFVNFLLDT